MTSVTGERGASANTDAHWVRSSGSSGPRALLLAAAVVAVASALLALLSAVDQADIVPNIVRVWIVVAAVSLLPGAPIALLLKIPRASLAGAVVVSTSFAVNLLVAQIEVVFGNYAPVVWQLVLCVLSLGMVAAAWNSTEPLAIRPKLDRLRVEFPLYRQRYVLAGVLLVAAVCFAIQTATLDTHNTGATGIVSHIGPEYVLALLLVSGVLAVALAARSLDHVVLVAAVLLLIVFTTMLVSLADGITSVPTAYVHRGLIEVIASLQGLPPPTDARFSWAGFFSLGAHISVAGGLSDISPMLLWAPAFFGGILALPTYSIALSLTGRRRIAWLAVVLCTLFNWYQQDYFAPQPTGFMLYLTVCAVLLWQLEAAPKPEKAKTTWFRHLLLTVPRRTLGTPANHRVDPTLAMEALLVLMIAALVVTHQLTPLVAIAALFLFSITGSTRYRLLWLTAAVIFVMWFSYGAVDYWKGHLAYVLGDVGQVSGAVQGGVSDRIGADPMYQRMQYLRLAASGSLLMFGFVGWLTHRTRRTWLMGGLLSMIPFGLVVVQSYGGEVVIRCFLLASPFVAAFAAEFVFRLLGFVRKKAPSVTRPPAWLRLTAVALVLTVLGLVLTATRGLNTSFEHLVEEQVRYGDALMREIPSGDVLMIIGTAPNLASPRYFGEVTVTAPESYDCLDDLAACMLEDSPDYIYTTAQSSAQLRLQLGYPATLVDDEMDKLVNSGEYVEVLRDSDLTILRKADAAEVVLQ